MHYELRILYYSTNMKKKKTELRKVTETQIGVIAENLVATHLILESDGRLSPFKPMADDEGRDLLVYDKITGNAVPLQIKSRTKTLKRYPRIVHFEVRKATFNKDQAAYVLAVLFDSDPRELYIKRVWLVPMNEWVQIAAERPEKYVIRPSVEMQSKDKYSPYRCEGIAEVVRRLIHMFEMKKQGNRFTNKICK